MKHIFFFFGVSFFFCGISQAQAQQGSLWGRILTADGQVARGVTVRLDHTDRGSVTDSRGEYRIANIPPGEWTLVVTALASGAQQKTVQLQSGESLRVDFRLKEDAAALEEVVVTSGRNAGAAKMPLQYLEDPQVYQNVSSDLMRTQVITSYDDALRNVPGITRTWESTGRAGDGASYFALRGFDAQPALLNGLPGISSGNVDPADVERIEVFKGPSATLFGGSFYAYGGLINTVTKKPYDSAGAELAYQFGSFGLNRITGDVNTPLGQDGQAALRVNMAYHSEGSFQDAGFKKALFAVPALSYKANDRLFFEVLAEIQEETRAVAPVFFHSNREEPLAFKTLEELNLDNSLSFTSNDLTIRNPKFNLQAQALYKLSGQWRSQTVISRSTVKSKGVYTYIWDDVSGDNDFGQYFHDEDQSTYTTDIQQNFNGDFQLGRMRDRIVIGLDYYHARIIDQGSGWAWGRNVTPQGDVNYVDPFSGEVQSPVYLTRASVDQLLAGMEPSNSQISNSSYSAYVSNVLNLTPSLLVMTSLRADYFDSRGEVSTEDDDFDQLALSPKFGVVYQALPERLSLFANWMNAFINVAPMQVSDPDGSHTRVKSFKPEQANQLELGIKTSLFQNRIQATVSAYDIRVTDRVSPDPANVNNYLQGGKVDSRGLELDAHVQLYGGWSLIAGYSYNKTKVLAGDRDDFYSEPGRAIGGQGPSHLANLWTTYTIMQGPLRHFGIGLGGNYGGRYAVIDNSETGVFYLPAYVTVDISLLYHMGPFGATFHVNNLNDEAYYTGYWSVNPQKPRNFSASLSYRF